MSIVVDYSIPATHFLLDRAQQAARALEIDLEQMIPTGDSAIPSFWVLDGARDQFESALDRESGISASEAVDELDDKTLYRAEWNLATDTFVQTILDHEAVIQDATGDAEAWEFQIQFLDTETLSAFRDDCQESGIEMTVERLYHSAECPGSPRLLTEPQQAVLERAYEADYFDVPRKTTLAELASRMDLSDQAVNERLRRGVKALIESTLKSPGTEECSRPAGRSALYPTPGATAGCRARSRRPRRPCPAPRLRSRLR